MDAAAGKVGIELCARLLKVAYIGIGGIGFAGNLVKNKAFIGGACFIQGRAQLE